MIGHTLIIKKKQLVVNSKIFRKKKKYINHLFGRESSKKI